MKNHYQILGLPSHCSQAEIKKAYRQLALKHHPDKNDGNKASEEQFKAILESYIILSDTETRSEYDYIKGFKTSYRTLGAEPGKPSPIKFLIQFKKIKEAVLNANGHINRNALFTVIDNLLSQSTIDFLIKERDISVNNLIIDELLTTCVFLDASAKPVISAKLIKLADGNARMIKRIEFLTTENKSIEINNNITTSQIPEASPPTTAILIFIIFLLMFALLLYMQYSKS